ncbi:ATP-grasp domain-containing protein [Pseudomonas purpurea]|uniref:ATP-grasp domain-containing protein n=1 Tax=Pseudomonas purpurea TaxID=3136737 RepID=UPI003262F5DB
MTIVALEALTFGLGKMVSAAEHFGVKLTLLTRDTSVYAYELANIDSDTLEIIELDTFDKPLVIDTLKAMPDVQGLLSTTDTWSLDCLDIAQACGLDSQDPESIRLVRNKFRLRNRLHELGLSAGKSIEVTPATADSREVCRGLEYPVIIKDTAGTGSQNVWMAHNDEDTCRVLAQARQAALKGKIAIEPFISGTLYSVETLSWKGENRVLAVTSRVVSEEPEFREEALASPVNLGEPKTQALSLWIDKVLSGVGYTNGFAHTEFFITETGFEVVEINPRLGGVQIGEALCRVYDYNLYEAFIEMALGRRPALMDRPLVAQKGVGQIIVYARQAGHFERVTGLERLAGHPGQPMFYPTAERGKAITSLTDQRASVGILVAEGENSEIALLNAFAARSKLTVVVQAGGSNDA